MVELNGRDRLVEFIDVSIRITGKETLAEIRIFVGGNRLFCNTVHLKHFYTCNSHELQLFDTSVTIKGRADDRSQCMFLVRSCLITDHSITHSISKCGAEQCV